ncbi:MAG: hypothetical protein H6814_11385 [Phycisphaeraceae bacterium]|nr:hypothetical protein [Phycisphaeraceae bacterium]
MAPRKPAKPLTHSALAKLKSKRPSKPWPTEEWVEIDRVVLNGGDRPKVRLRAIDADRGVYAVQRQSVKPEPGALRLPFRAVGLGPDDVIPEIESEEPRGYKPPHLGMDYLPGARPPRPERIGGKGWRRPLSVFYPDNRREPDRLSYPRSAVGRIVIDNPGVQGCECGTAFMVSARICVAPAHGFLWSRSQISPTPNSVEFVPGYSDGAGPFGSAYATGAFYWGLAKNDNQNNPLLGPTVYSNPNAIKYDYVALVLDRPIGLQCGFFGVKAYHESWDGIRAWLQSGYPNDLTNIERQTILRRGRIAGIARNGGVIDSWYVPNTQLVGQSLSHFMDTDSGQSGQPTYGFWDGEQYPSVVGVEAAEGIQNDSQFVEWGTNEFQDDFMIDNCYDNRMAAGSALRYLCAHAILHYPV